MLAGYGFAVVEFRVTAVPFSSSHQLVDIPAQLSPADAPRANRRRRVATRLNDAQLEAYSLVQTTAPHPGLLCHIVKHQRGVCDHLPVVDMVDMAMAILVVNDANSQINTALLHVGRAPDQRAERLACR